MIDRSSSGATLFIEPAALSRLREELEVLRIEEDCEVRRILYQLTDEIAGYEEVMRDNLRMLVKLDVIFAGANSAPIWVGGTGDQHGWAHRACRSAPSHDSG